MFPSQKNGDGMAMKSPWPTFVRWTPTTKMLLDVRIDVAIVSKAAIISWKGREDETQWNPKTQMDVNEGLSTEIL